MIVVDSQKRAVLFQGIKLLTARPHATKELEMKLSRFATKYTRRKRVQAAVARASSASSTSSPPPPVLPDHDLDPDALVAPVDVVVEEAMAELRKMALLNDTQFAEFFVKSRQRYRPRSLFMLKGELRQRGVDNDTVAAAVAGPSADAHASDDDGSDEEVSDFYGGGGNRAGAGAGYDEEAACMALVRRKASMSDDKLRAVRRRVHACVRAVLLWPSFCERCGVMT